MSTHYDMFPLCAASHEREREREINECSPINFDATIRNGTSIGFAFHRRMPFRLHLIFSIRLFIYLFFFFAAIQAYPSRPLQPPPPPVSGPYPPAVHHEDHVRINKRNLQTFRVTFRVEPFD